MNLDDNDTQVEFTLDFVCGPVKHAVSQRLPYHISDLPSTCRSVEGLLTWSSPAIDA